MLSAVAARKAAALAASSVREGLLTSSDSTPLNPAEEVDDLPTETSHRTRQKRKRPSKPVEKAEGVVSEPSPKKRAPKKSFAGAQGANGRAEAIPGPSSSGKSRQTYSPSRPVGDAADTDEDSDVELNLSGERQDQPVLSVNPPTTSPAVSSFQAVPDENIFAMTEGTYVVLRLNETICFTGTVELMVLRGTIDLLGTPLVASKTAHRVFAPKSHPLPIITASGPSRSTLSLNIPPQVVQRCQASDCVLLLRALQTGVEGLGDVCRVFAGSFDGGDTTSRDSAEVWRLRGFYPVSFPSPTLHSFTMPSSWNNAMDDIITLEDIQAPLQSPPIILVKGPKRSGKSTFGRTLLNRLCGRYQRVAFLECDLGQSEFTPGGMVALNVVSQPLFGPSFTHLMQPYCAHYIGSSTPRSSPSLYLSAISALIQTYRMDLQYSSFDDNGAVLQDDSRESTLIPLVVNTQGWTKGMGADLLRRIEEMVEPTHIVGFELDSKAGSANAPPNEHEMQPWPNAPGMSKPPHVFNLQSIPPSPLTNLFAASEYRSLNILSYFYAQFPPSSIESLFGSASLSWDTTKPLVAQAPFEVDPKVALDGVVLVGPSSEDVVAGEIGEALNCSIVGLVKNSIGMSPETTSPLGPLVASGIPYSQGAPAPDPVSSQCVGLALIRGMTLSDSTPSLQVLTPISAPALLAKSRVMVKGDFELPIWGFLDHTSQESGGDESLEKVCDILWTKVPYLQYHGSQGVRVAGGKVRRARRNLMRKGHT